MNDDSRQPQPIRDAVAQAREVVKARMRRAADAIEGVRENPLAMLFGGAFIGFLAGILIPVSRFESEHIGPIADGVKDRVKDAGAAAVRRGVTSLRDTTKAVVGFGDEEYRASTFEPSPYRAGFE